MLRRALTIGLLVMAGTGAGLLSTPVIALTAVALKESCAHSEASQLLRCTLYVEGFVDGALTTDPNVADAVLQEAPELSAWMRRAISTRVGDQMKRFGESFYADFCLPEAERLDQVVNRIKATNAPQDPETPASYWLYQLLRDEFPCTAAAGG